jgi:hypothetical protein
MKLAIIGMLAIAAAGSVLQTGSSQAPSEPIRVRGCLQGNGSDPSPWSLRGVVLPAPRPAAAAAPRGDGGGRGAGGRGRGDAGRGAAQAPPPAPAPAQPPVDLKLTGIDMSPWRNMFVEVEGTLGPRPASGLQEFRVDSARSAWGECR